MKTRNLTWDDVKKLQFGIIRQICQDEWMPDLIVGIGRGGLPSATMLSHFLGVKMVSLDVSLRDGVMGPESNCWLPEMAVNGQRILIVDDINDTGDTINWIRDDWNSAVANNAVDELWETGIRFATLFDNATSRSTVTVSYSGETINKLDNDAWIVFPWEDWWDV